MVIMGCEAKGGVATFPWNFDDDPEIDGIIFNWGGIVSQACENNLSEACKIALAKTLVHELVIA